MSNPFIFIGYDNHTTAILHPTDHSRNVELLAKWWQPHSYISSRGYSPNCSIHTRRDLDDSISQYKAWAESAQNQLALLAATLGIEP